MVGSRDQCVQGDTQGLGDYRAVVHHAQNALACSGACIVHDQQSGGDHWRGGCRTSQSLKSEIARCSSALVSSSTRSRRNLCRLPSLTGPVPPLPLLPAPLTAPCVPTSLRRPRAGRAMPLPRAGLTLLCDTTHTHERHWRTSPKDLLIESPGLQAPGKTACKLTSTAGGHSATAPKGQPVPAIKEANHVRQPWHMSLPQ